MKPFTKLFFLFTVFLVLVFFALMYFFLSGIKKTVQLPQLFTPTPFQAPKITFSPKFVDPKTKDFIVTAVYPDISVPIVYQYETIQVLFNQELDPSNFYYTLSPYNKVHVNIFKTENAFYFELVPQEKWEDKTYTLTIRSSTKSKKGAVLGKDIVIAFTINTKFQD